jgi:archaellum component FlaC
LAVAASVAVLTLACAERNKGPEIASSAGDASYAERLPDRLNQAGERYDQNGAMTEEVAQKLPTYPTALDNPDWGVVQRAYEMADEDGQSGAYAAHHDEEVVLARFHTEERKPLVRRVAASNEYVTKEKGCEVELWGATDRGLEKGIEERLEERRRSDSGVHALITSEIDAVGKQNEKTLRDQVDEIRFASYVVHIGLQQEEEEMRRQADEASSARSALEDRIEELKAKEKPDTEQIGRMEAALANLDPTVQKAKERLERAEQRRKDLEKKYQDALEQLNQAVETAKDAQEQAKK